MNIHTKDGKIDFKKLFIQSGLYLVLFLMLILIIAKEQTSTGAGQESGTQQETHHAGHQGSPAHAYTRLKAPGTPYVRVMGSASHASLLSTPTLLPP